MAIDHETFKDGGLKYVLLKLKARIETYLADKYDVAGGEITGNVLIDGNLTLDIEDEDYDAGIRFTKSLDNNAGTVLTLTGYANSDGSNVNYKPVIRNVAQPVNNYDVANKLYVDSCIVKPISYLVFLDDNGDIDTVSSTLTYSAVKSNLTNSTTDVYLDVLYGSSSPVMRFKAHADQDMDTNNGPLKFHAIYTGSDSMRRLVVFTLDKSNTLTVTHYILETMDYKSQDVVTDATNTLKYPSVKATYDWGLSTFQRKPVTIWETDGSTGLVGLQSDISASPAWQLAGLDFSPYKRIKIYALSGKGSTNASTEPAKILEMSLDVRNKNATFGHYIGSTMFQNPNDSNRTGTLTCAVSGDLTSFAVLRMTSLYGTSATSNNGTNSYVFMIEGYYD